MIVDRRSKIIYSSYRRKINNMNKLDLTISIMSIISLVGLIVLIILNKDITVLLPILTILVGFLVGSKKEDIITGIGLLFKK